jgi:UDPglucose 6-dehydrogenase
MNIAVIGAGHVGLTTAACLAEIGHHVCCADSDLEKLTLLRSGKVPFFEPYLAQMVESHSQNGALVFASTEEAIEYGKAIFICVGTAPLENGEADLSAVESVARTIAQKAHGFRLVIEKSTVPVQTGRQLHKHLGHYTRNDLHYEVVSNPEFLREGCAVTDFLHPDRIVMGVESSRAAEQLKEIYRPILDQTFVCPVHSPCQPAKVSLVITDRNSAELIKHASNSFLAMKISFINLVADLCEVVGADINKVAEGVGLDPRIGAAFLKPGIGFGGFCFPKDLQAFVRIAEKFGCDFSLLKEVERINLRRVDQFVEKVKKELWVLRGKRIGVWGLAFKPNTDDIRYAPSLAIIKRLLAEGAEVQAYDPQVCENARSELPTVHYCSNVYEVARGAEAILVLTEWEEFRHVDWQRIRVLMDRPLIVDGRNMFSEKEICSYSFYYVGIGRAPAAPVLQTVGLDA